MEITGRGGSACRSTVLDEGDAEWLGEGLVVIGGASERRWGGRCSVGFTGKKLGVAL